MWRINKIKTYIFIIRLLIKRMFIEDLLCTRLLGTTDKIVNKYSLFFSK